MSLKGAPRGPNRETGETPVRTRRCDPAAFGLDERGTHLAIISHCCDQSQWEGS